MSEAAAEGVSPAVRQEVPAYSWYALLVLTAIYVLNFLDRSVIYILFTPIKAEMAFSDLQLALLGTTSFVIFYTLLGVPFGRLADRVSRKNLIAAGLAVWSLFSGLTGSGWAGAAAWRSAPGPLSPRFRSGSGCCSATRWGCWCS